MLQNIHSWSIRGVKCLTFCHECLLICNNNYNDTIFSTKCKLQYKNIYCDLMTGQNFTNLRHHKLIVKILARPAGKVLEWGGVGWGGDEGCG